MILWASEQDAGAADRACPAIAFCTITGGWLRYLTTLVIGSLLEGKGKISI
jgi:hypothetical protein